MRAAIIPAILATVLAGAAANAAPIAQLEGIAVGPAQFRAANWNDHPLMYPGNWERHQRQWDAIEGRGANARSTPCARYRSYDRASHTYLNRSGRRVPCP